MSLHEEDNRAKHSDFNRDDDNGNHPVLNRSWAEVNLDQLAANVRLIRRSVHRACEIMGVVKADAYGHGVLQVAPVMLANGVSRQIGRAHV